MRTSPESPVGERAGSLRRSAQQALLWSAGLNLFRDVLQFVQMLILVRLLDPAVYGMAGMATTVVNFVGLLSFQHLVSHVIQVRSDGDVDYEQHFTAGLVLNGLLFFLTNLIGLSVRWSSAYAELQPLIHVLSLSFLLAVPLELRMKMLEREHRWTRLRPLQMIGLIVTVVIGVGMALAGTGVYALIVPAIIAPSVFLIDLFVVARWRPRWRWSYASYKDALSFGLNRAGSNALNSGRKLLESSLITRFFEFSALGVFGRAEGLANLFCVQVSQQVMSALYPVITRADIRSDRFRRIAGLVLRSVTWVVIPMAVFFSIEAGNLVELFYGSKWLEVVPLLPLAMLIGGTRSIGAAAYRLLLANNEQKLCIWSDVAAFSSGALAILTLVPLGVVNYMAGAAAISAIVATVLLTLLVRTRGLEMKAVLIALFPPLAAATLAFLVVWALADVLFGQVPKIVGTVVVGILFFAVYLLVLRLFFRSPLEEIIDYVPGGRRVASLMRL